MEVILGAWGKTASRFGEDDPELHPKALPAVLRASPFGPNWNAHGPD